MTELSATEEAWSWYSPDRLVLVLRAWYKIQAASETGPHSAGESSTPVVEEGIVKKTRAVSLRPQLSENPGAGFEELAALRADVMAALLDLDIEQREMIWFSYVEGFGPHECARRRGLKLWHVLQLRVDGLERMAMFLGWTPSQEWMVRTQKQRVYQRKRRWETLRLVVARALKFCPLVGDALTPCPVCIGGRFGVDGHHIGERMTPRNGLANGTTGPLPIEEGEVAAFREYLDNAQPRLA